MCMGALRAQITKEIWKIAAFSAEGCCPVSVCRRRIAGQPFHEGIQAPKDGATCNNIMKKGK